MDGWIDVWDGMVWCRDHEVETLAAAAKRAKAELRAAMQPLLARCVGLLLLLMVVMRVWPPIPSFPSLPSIQHCMMG